MSSLVEGFLPTLDAARALLGAYGLRPFKVFRLIRRWTGPRAGSGVKSDEWFAIKVMDADPKVRIVDPKDVVASGGELTMAAFDIGPLTPDYGVGGSKYADIDPVVDGQTTEVFFVVFGPGLPTEGALCKRLSSQTGSPFRYTFRVQRTGGRV